MENSGSDLPVSALFATCLRAIIKKERGKLQVQSQSHCKYFIKGRSYAYVVHWITLKKTVLEVSILA